MFNAIRPDHWFHTPACRKQFHKHEGAFGKVQQLVEKYVRVHLRELQERVAHLEACVKTVR
jgi:hypothetical protein